MLPSDFAHHLLRAPGLLQVHAAVCAGEDIQRRWTGLDQRLLDAVEEDPLLDTGAVALHQVHGARALFEERRQRHGPEAPLVVAALCMLARDLLVFHRGELMWRREGHLRWREQWSGRTLIEPVRAAATALFCLEGDPGDRWFPRGLRAQREAWDQALAAPLLPPVADPDVLYLRARGLVELHRHDSLTRQPAHIWYALLHTEVPALAPGRAGAPDPNLLLRQARALTRAIDGLLALIGQAENSTGESQSIEAAWQAIKAPTGLQWNAGAPLPPPQGASVADSGPEEAFLRADRERLMDALHALTTPTPEERLPGRAAAALGQALHCWLICRHHLETATVHPPQGARGLDRFKRRYVDHPWQRSVWVAPEVRWRQAWRDGGIRVLEVKTGPGGGLAKQAEGWLQALAEAEARHRDRAEVMATQQGRAATTFAMWREEGLVARILRDPPRPSAVGRLGVADPALERPGVRLVVHFLRTRDEPLPPGGPKARRARWEALRAKVAGQAEELRQVLEQPAIGSLFVGVDIASDELAAPAEVFAPAFRVLRAPWAISRRSALAPGLALHSLGVSVHAGEEFEHLCAGMRQVDEHVRFLHLQRGDRLGHALALGLEPSWWRERTGGGVSQRRQGRLDDLVWLHDRLAGLPHHAHLCHALRDEASKLCHTIYGEVFELGTLFEAWTLREVDPAAHVDDNEGAPTPSPDPLKRPAQVEAHKRLARASAPARRVWEAYTFDPTVRARGEERVAVRDAPALDAALRAVQDQQLAQLAHDDIAIEANPSSNLAIGALGRVADHPIFRWLPVRAADRSAHMPRVCVCSDDPAIFVTELAHEYALLAEAARGRGHTPGEVRAWLDTLAEAAERLRFSPADH